MTLTEWLQALWTWVCVITVVGALGLLVRLI